MIYLLLCERLINTHVDKNSSDGEHTTDRSRHGASLETRTFKGSPRHSQGYY
jgi:hypothetical protein